MFTVGKADLIGKMAWLMYMADAAGTNFFVRPMDPGAIFVDLDKYTPAHEDKIIGLAPR